MIFRRLPIIRLIFGGNDADAADAAKRWRRAFVDEPELATDLIRIGGILRLRAVRMVDGVPATDPIDPIRMAYDEGRRAAVIEFLALGGVNHHDLNKLMENNND